VWFAALVVRPATRPQLRADRPVPACGHHGAVHPLRAGRGQGTFGTPFQVGSGDAGSFGPVTVSTTTASAQVAWCHAGRRNTVTV
jgi:hypothetical protein